MPQPNIHVSQHGDKKWAADSNQGNEHDRMGSALGASQRARDSCGRER
ncbi:MAG: hypothetical protein WA879_07640 [Candidatus Acidiferrales bacterium]